MRTTGSTNTAQSTFSPRYAQRSGNAAGGGISGGGSTLTQQYVKQVRLQRATATLPGRRSSPQHEPQDLGDALRDRTGEHPHQGRDLERYLNIAYYGDGAYGVQAAARHYFNTDASQLTVAQAAMLAGLVQNPSQTDPVNNLDGALARRQAVLAAQVRYQGMPQSVADEAAAEGFDARRCRRWAVVARAPLSVHL